MKKYLLILLIGILSLSTAHAQLLTEIPDTTNTRRDTPDYYVAIGHTSRLVTGYRQMQGFYERQGFDNLRLQAFWTLGIGRRIGGNFYLDLLGDWSFSENAPEDVRLSNGHTLSLQERKRAVHLLLGYRFWEKRYTSFLFHGGVSFLRNRAEFAERRPDNFDFTTANIDVPEGVRSWPLFVHRQGALHLALQMKLSYPRPSWWSTDIEMKIGFVSGLRSKAWSVEHGQGINTPTDRVQYFYISGLYQFYNRRKK